MMTATTAIERHAVNATAVLEMALRHAREGRRVFPLSRNAKTPAMKGWQDRATSDEASICEWFGPGGRYEGHNLGLCTGTQRTNPTTGQPEYLVAIDLDTKAGKNGAEFLQAECDRRSIALDEGTTVQRTPSNGLHLLYWASAPLVQGANVLGEGSGVDLRSVGGYVVAAPSVIDGKAYELVKDAPIAPMGELETLFKVAITQTKAADSAPLGGVDASRAKSRAVEYLKTAPLSVEGKGGDQTAYKVAAKLKDMGCTEAQTLALMAENWNPRCEPPWTGDDLAAKVRNAYSYGREPAGVSAPEAVFTATEQVEGDAPHPLEALNQKHAYVLLGGAGCVLWEKLDAQGRTVIDFVGVDAFRTFYKTTTFQSGRQTRPIGDAWLEWPGRRTYQGILFAPGKTLPPEYLNLWRGFGVTPKPGKWTKMRAHIRDVICSGDPKLDAYVMGWLARAVQFPGQPGEVALVLRGKQGTGKGTLGHWMRRIFGNSGRQVSNPEHLVGRFNSHLKDCAFLFADEAFFAGDRKHIGVLKSLITEPTIQVELKGRDVFETPNCLHVLMASNEEWVVPAAADDRRYCVVDVSDVHRGHHSYFEAVLAECNSGGLEAMLHDLMHYDLRGFDVRAIPATEALDDQKVQTMGSADRWLFDLLDGSPMPGFSDSSTWGDEGFKLDKNAAYEDYLSKCKSRYVDKYPKSGNAFWRHLRGLFDGLMREYRPAGGSRHVILPKMSDARGVLYKSWGLRAVAPASNGDVPESDPPTAKKLTAGEIFD